MLKFIGGLTVITVIAFGGLYATGNLSGSADVQLTEKGKQNVSDMVQQAKDGAGTALESAREKTLTELDGLQDELRVKTKQ